MAFLRTIIGIRFAQKLPRRLPRWAYPKKSHRLPAVLNQEEVAQLIDAASTPFHLLPLYFHLLGTAQPSPAGPDVSSLTSMTSAAAPTVVGLWWSSRDSPLPKSNFVLHHRLPPQHETTRSTSHLGSLATFSLPLRLASRQILLASSLCFPGDATICPINHMMH